MLTETPSIVVSDFHWQSMEDEAIRRLIESEKRGWEDRDREDLRALQAEQSDRQRQRDDAIARIVILPLVRTIASQRRVPNSTYSS